ncbi:YceI family protein [Aquimarina agarilytica]|uniref:YceI family protein n=1 Tax=Aquimarina agarilytica TaxID=1087449 RepID=UPI00028851B1|nr:YceI family protein [Aquimarina agarilytica]
MVNWRSKYTCLFVFILLETLIGCSVLFAQETYKTTLGSIKFDAAKTALEPIHAINKKLKVILRPNDGALVALLEIRDFSFPNTLMQEHFNENYMESDQYPTASFKAKIDNLEVFFNKSSAFDVLGEFRIHGVKKELLIPVKLIKKATSFNLKSSFKLFLQDFNIKIPSLMFYKIAEEVEVVIDAELVME